MRKSKLVTEESNSESKLEKKHFEYLIEACSKLNHQCNKKELKVSQLKWQPHYSTVFRQIKTKLEKILETDSTKTLDILGNIDYLLMKKNEIYKSFSELSRFISMEASNIGDSEALHRKKFFNYIVHFQFLALELQAYFPGSMYQPNKVIISKLEPKHWWESTFPNKIFVEKSVFMTELKKKFNFLNVADLKCFENTLNFTKTNYVTTFEFDLITRLFVPWDKFVEVWRKIYNHPGYLHFGNYGETVDLLNKYINQPGTYVFRISCKDLGFWTIGYVKKNNEIGQVKVNKSSLIDAIIEGKKNNLYLYPKGELNDQDLSLYLSARQEVKVDSDFCGYITFEEFNECKICREAEKDVMLESCGHKICESCYKKLFSNDRKKCPFCNQPIKSMIRIVHKIQDSPSSEYIEASPRVSVYGMSNKQPVQDQVEKRSSSSRASRDISMIQEDFIYGAENEPATVVTPSSGPAPPPRPSMVAAPIKSRIKINYPIKLNNQTTNEESVNSQESASDNSRSVSQISSFSEDKDDENEKDSVDEYEAVPKTPVPPPRPSLSSGITKARVKINYPIILNQSNNSESTCNQKSVQDEEDETYLDLNYISNNQVEMKTSKEINYKVTNNMISELKSSLKQIHSKQSKPIEIDEDDTYATFDDASANQNQTKEEKDIDNCSLDSKDSGPIENIHIEMEKYEAYYDLQEPIKNIIKQEPIKIVDLNDDMYQNFDDDYSNHPVFKDNENETYCEIQEPNIVKNQPIKNEPIMNPPIKNRQIIKPPIENRPIKNPPIENRPIKIPPIENQPIKNPPIENRPIENDQHNKIEIEDEETYCDIQEQENPFSKWNKEEISNAMKIARNNTDIALDILKEYCPRNY